MTCEFSLQTAFRTAAMMLSCALVQTTDPAETHKANLLDGNGVPVYKVKSDTFYGAGYQLGQLASERIKGWLEAPEMRTILGWTSSGTGADVLAKLKELNTVEFPDLVEQMTGIAAGAGVPVDAIWATNLIEELQSFHPNVGEPSWAKADHCSDVYVGGVAHGHNEDWSVDAKSFWYFLEEEIAGHRCTGVVYPGVLLGNAVLWSDWLYSTQNALSPSSHRIGVSSTFMQRKAVCSGGRGIASAVAVLTNATWSLGASINLVDLATGEMASVETHEATHAVRRVPYGTNWTHFNMYKLPPMVGADVPTDITSSVHRQARADALPAPKTAEDIVDFLSDDHDPKYPVYRPATMVTLLVNFADRAIHAWVNVTATSGGPTLSWPF